MSKGWRFRNGSTVSFSGSSSAPPYSGAVSRSKKVGGAWLPAGEAPEYVPPAVCPCGKVSYETEEAAKASKEDLGNPYLNAYSCVIGPVTVWHLGRERRAKKRRSDYV